MRYRQQLSYKKPLTLSLVIKMVLDPVLIISCLLGIAYYFDEYIGRDYLLLCLVIFALTFPGTWSKQASLRSEFNHTFTIWTILVGILLFFGYATSFLHHFQHDVVIYWVLLTPLVILAAHIVIRSVLARVYNRHVIRNSIIIGASDIGIQLYARLLEDRQMGIMPLGFFDDRPANRTSLRENQAGQLVGRLDDIAQFAKAHSADIIYIALPMTSQPRILRLLYHLKDTTTSIYFVPDIFIFDLIQARIDDVGDRKSVV